MIKSNIIAENELKKIYPFATISNVRLYLPFLNKYFSHYQINTPLRICAFLAQVGHESGQLRYAEEIASGAAYEGRKDLGNVHPGDGRKYKGRGLIQVTGRFNYDAISKSLGIDFLNFPEKLKEPEFAVLSAFWFWDKNCLNVFADREDFKGLTKKINGGYNGLKDREALYKKALEVLL